MFKWQRSQPTVSRWLKGLTGSFWQNVVENEVLVISVIVFIMYCIPILLKSRRDWPALFCLQPSVRFTFCWVLCISTIENYSSCFVNRLGHFSRVIYIDQQYGVENCSSVWHMQRFTHDFTERLINDVPLTL